MIGPTSSQIRSSVGTLYTRWSGCSSKAILVTPASWARRAIRRHRVLASSHWRSRNATASAGHGYQTQLIVLDPGPSPGHPDMVTIVETPIRAASSIVDRMIASCALSCLGCMTQDEQFRASIRRARDLKARRNVSMARESASRWSICR